MTETQKRVAKIWASVIPNRTARMFVPESNFFEEGGHSILAQQMLFNVRKEWKEIDIPMSVIFQSQTLGEFATEIDRAQDPTGLRLDVPPLINIGSNAEDEAYAADARDLAKQLPNSIRSADVKVPGPKTVFLTGATGFLGSYILRQLLSDPETRVVAHVRGKDTASGVSRIETISKAYGIWSDDWRPRLEAVTGDISKPNLGLSQADWDRVANDADVIIHNGAQVNWMLPYSSMRAANVLSTVECVSLAATGKPKSLAFVSSTSTLDSDHYVELSQKSVAEGGTGVQEDDDLEGSRKGLGTGYGQSKWASEYIVREAGKRGLVGAVIRPGYVTGDPVSGTSITDDFLVRLWKGCLQVQARPDITNTVNQVPVTQVSRIVVASVLHPPVSPLGVVQVTSHPRLTMNEWIGALEKYGYNVPKVPYADWCAKLLAYVSDEKNEEHALLPLFHFVTGDLPANTVAPELDDRNAAAALRSAGGLSAEEEKNPLVAGAVTLDVAGRYLAYLVATGFMPAPEGKGEREVPKLELGEEKLAALAALGGRAAAR
jgi:L-aminoadipate-semialdehyde dehydrogenase